MLFLVSIILFASLAAISRISSLSSFQSSTFVESSSSTIPATTEDQTTPTMSHNQDMPTTPAMTATPPPPMMEDVSITLSNVSLFMDCSTSIERTCTIQTSEAQCTTGFGVTYQRPGVQYNIKYCTNQLMRLTSSCYSI